MRSNSLAPTRLRLSVRSSRRAPLCTQGDWCAVLDVTVDRVYYCNKVTKATQWAPPPHWDLTLEETARQRSDGKGGDIPGSSSSSNNNNDTSSSSNSSQSSNTVVDTTAEVGRSAKAGSEPSASSTLLPHQHSGSAPAASVAVSPVLLPQSARSFSPASTGSSPARRKSVRFSLTRAGDATPLIVDPRDAVDPDAPGSPLAGTDSGRRSSTSNAVGEWVSAVDSQTGREYFYNTVTRKTAWRRPSQLSPGSPVNTSLGASAHMQAVATASPPVSSFMFPEEHTGSAGAETREEGAFLSRLLVEESTSLDALPTARVCSLTHTHSAPSLCPCFCDPVAYSHRSSAVGVHCGRPERPNVLLQHHHE